MANVSLRLNYYIINIFLGECPMGYSGKYCLTLCDKVCLKYLIKYGADMCNHFLNSKCSTINQSRETN